MTRDLMTRDRSQTHRSLHALLLALAACLGVLITAPAAQALPGGSSSTAPGVTFGGAGGGGSRVAINDFVGLDDSAFLFSISAHRRFEDDCDASGGVCQLGSFETEPATVKVSGGYRGRETGSDPKGVNKAAFDQVGILNRCKVTTPVLHNLSTAPGCDFAASNARWFEVHPAPPTP